ncbi:MAG: hypothetical protein HZA81_03915 [Candidatus Taylorbacteria bacterium]|nr:hypothetical protein [Candidatus Taylorbacteria bacterium]
MKSATTAKTSRRAQASGSGASATAPAASSNGTPPAPQAPSRPPNVHSVYLAEKSAIFAGRVTKPEDLYQPLKRFNEDEHFVVGEADQRTRELFSLMIHYRHLAEAVQTPKNRSEIKVRKGEIKALSQVADAIRADVWQCVHALYPEVYGKDVSFVEGWRIVTEMTDKERAIRDVKKRGLSPEHEAELLERIEIEFSEEAKDDGDDDGEGDPLDRLAELIGRGGRTGAGSLLDLLAAARG